MLKMFSQKFTFSMVIILDSSSEHGAHTWNKLDFLILVKSFGYRETVVKSEIFFGKDLFYFICAQHVLSYISYISSMAIRMKYTIDSVGQIRNEY